MSKIRINELARELEVPNNRILELLPGLGVTEKKTHSSSIDEDVAVRIRHLLSGEGVDGGYVHEEEVPEPDSVPAAASETSKPVVAETIATEPVREPVPLEVKQEVGAPVVPEVRRAQPVRPPVGIGNREASTVPAPPSPSTPTLPVQRNVPIPARPAPPSPRPGQILSGPRQPLPANLSEMPAPEPHRPTPPPPRAAPPAPSQQPQQPSAAPTVPALPRPAAVRAPAPQAVRAHRRSQFPSSPGSLPSPSDRLPGSPPPGPSFHRVPTSWIA